MKVGCISRDAAVDSKDVSLQTTQLLPYVGSGCIRIEIALPNDDLEEQIA